MHFGLRAMSYEEKMNRENLEIKQHRLAYLLLTLAILLSYSNSFRAEWHFDDINHIRQNQAIQIKDFTSDSMLGVFYAAPRHSDDPLPRIFRPLASLTFALNWYLGKDDVFGYHLFNVLLHAISAFLLFEVIRALYASPKLCRDHDGAGTIALSAAMLWALNPIQTQAVTYIVQRMTVMAAMFLILGVLLYIRGRLSKNRNTQAFCFIGVAFAYVFALASKENAIILPAVLLLVEIAFFYKDRSSTPSIKTIVVLGIFAIIIGVWWIVGTNSAGSRVLDGYSIRPYTLLERLITQPRAIFLYLSLIFYPLPSRLSIQHNLTHSSSLIEPWTTLLSIIMVLALICFSIVRIRENPIVSFSILFFFLCHVVESSILPLELVFEHRNYLPSMFLFWPIGFCITKCMKYLRSKRPKLIMGFCSLLFCLVFGLMTATYARNAVWTDEVTLWQDAVKKGDKLDRPYIYLANYYYRNGDFDKALDLYAQAYENYSERKNDYSFIILNNTANIFFDFGNYAKAVEIWYYAANKVKDNSIIRRNLAIGYARLGELGNAIDQLNLAFRFSAKSADLYALKVQYLFEAKRYLETIAALEQAVEYGYNETNAKALAAMASYYLGDNLKCKKILKEKYQKDQTIETLIWLLAINLILDDNHDIELYRNQISKATNVEELRHWIERIQKPDYPLSRESLLLEELNRIMGRRTDYLS